MATLSWQQILQSWGLGVPDRGRVARGRQLWRDRKVVPDGRDRWLVHGKHTARISSGGSGDCSCIDFRTRMQGQGTACKHLVAVAMHFEAQGMAPRPAAASASPAPIPAPPSRTDRSSGGWPQYQIAQAVDETIAHLAERVHRSLLDGESPLLWGPTGAGKTSTVHRVLELLGGEWGLEEVAGSDSWTDADLIGCWTAAREWAWGPVGRAFQRARNGEKVLVFMDEITRFSPRALDILMRTVQPVGVHVAQARRIDIPDFPPLDARFYVLESPLMGYQDWSPAQNVRWVAAGNPGANPLDAALVRRFRPIKFDLDRSVLDALSPDVRTVVAALWESYKKREIPIPLEYQALTTAREPGDLFRKYVERIEVMDAICADAVRTVIGGHDSRWV